MSVNINLITREEKQEQVKSKIVKGSSILLIVLLIIVALASGYFFIKAQDLKNKVKEEDRKITSMRSSIQDMAEVEIVARSLYQRYLAIQDIFAERVYVSYLLEHFDSKIPPGVTVDSFSPSRDGKITISGNAPNYISVSDFLRNFTAEEDPQVFTSVQLNNVSLNSADRSVKYTMVLSYDPEALKFNK